MVLHIGGDVFVSKKSIVAVLSINTLKDSEITEKFLSDRLAAGEAVTLDKKCKSVVVVEEKTGQRIYYSPISATTLMKRMNSENIYSL